MKNLIYPIFRRICFSLVITLLFVPELAAETPSEASETPPESEPLPIPAEPDPLPQQAATSDEWQISFTPYLWMVNITGTQTIGQITVPLEIDFSDVIDRLKFAFAFHFEASKGRWVGIFDFNYAAVGDNQVLTTPSGETADFNFDIFYQDFLAFYRIPYDRHSFDVIFGTRYRFLKMDLRFTSGLEPRFDIGWWDPLVGVRYIGKLHPEKLDVIVNGKVGGFDIGSQFTGEFSAGVKINLTPKISMPVLYRYLHIQYQEGSGANLFNYHANEQGLLIGLGFNF